MRVYEYCIIIFDILYCIIIFGILINTCKGATCALQCVFTMWAAWLSDTTSHNYYVNTDDPNTMIYTLASINLLIYHCLYLHYEDSVLSCTVPCWNMYRG